MTTHAALIWSMLTLMAVGAQSAAIARREPRQPSRHPANAKTTDADFVKEAAQRGLAEVALGNLALERAQNPDVRQFARRIVDERSGANQQLMDLAKSQGVDVPKEMGPEQRNTKARLSTLSGATFDREYMRAAVTDHARDIAELRDYSQNGKNEALKAWAARTLPTLRKHQQLAGAAAAKVGAS